MQVTIYNMCYMASRMRTVAVYGNTKAEGGDGGVSLNGCCSTDLPVTLLPSSCFLRLHRHKLLPEPVGAYRILQLAPGSAPACFIMTKMSLATPCWWGL